MGREKEIEGDWEIEKEIDRHMDACVYILLVNHR